MKKQCKECGIIYDVDFGETRCLGPSCNGEWKKRISYPPSVKIEHTARGFGTCDLKDKYGNDFYVRQSSGNMSDVWIGIKLTDNDLKPLSNGDMIATILVDNKTWRAIREARREVRK